MATRFDQGLARSIRRLVLIGVGLVLVMWIGCATTTRVDAGHVGVLVKLAGGDRGVQDTPMTPGWHFFNPATEQVILFPISVQNVVWTKDVSEGRAIDESLTFSSIEGANINADVGLSFHVDPALAPKLYNRFRQNDVIALANGYMRNTVRESFNIVASKMKVEDIYGAGKSKMVADVVSSCRDVFAKDGILIDQLTINGALRLPPLIEQAINRALETEQNAHQSQNKVAQVEAEATQAITQAHGEAEAARQRAQGEADALLIKARAEAQANEIVRLSMSGPILQYRAVEKWDGKLPTYQAGQTPLLTFDVGKLDTGLTEAERQKRLKDLLGSSAPAASGAPAAAPAPAPAQPANPPKPQ